MRFASSALFGFCVLFSSCEKPMVQVVIVDRGLVETTVTSIEPGVVKSRRDSTLSPPVSGRIVEVLRHEGDAVKKDDVILRIESDLERIARDEARSELLRIETLGTEAIATEESLERAQFLLQRAEVSYERCFVRAPFDGTLVEFNARAGEMIYGSMPLDMVIAGSGERKRSLARVVDEAQLYVECDIDEADAGKLRPGQTVRITLDALGGKIIPGKIARTGLSVSTAEGRSRAVRAEVEVVDLETMAQRGQRLLVGMSADIEVILESRQDAVRIPTLTILESEHERSVFVLDEGKLRRKSIQTSAANWEFTEVREGLRPGELVVVPSDRSLLVEGRETQAAATESKHP